VVVASSDRYVVVSKIGKGAVVAESLDPRRNSAETT
jgi:hypothetical protein